MLLETSTQRQLRYVYLYTLTRTYASSGFHDHSIVCCRYIVHAQRNRPTRGVREKDGTAHRQLAVQNNRGRERSRRCEESQSHWKRVERGKNARREFVHSGHEKCW